MDNNQPVEFHPTLLPNWSVLKPGMTGNGQDSESRSRTKSPPQSHAYEKLQRPGPNTSTEQDASLSIVSRSQ